MKQVLIFASLTLTCLTHLNGQELGILALDHQALKKAQQKIVELQADNSTVQFLEQTQQSFTQETSACSIIKAEGRTYTFDFLKSKVHAYDEAGNYLHTIYRKGKGPNEYKQIRKVFTAGPGKLAIWDSMLDKIILFNDKGAPVREIMLNYDLDAILYHSGFYYGLGLDNEHYNLIKLDESGKTAQKWDVLGKEDMEVCIKMKSFNCLFVYGNQVCFAVQPMNSIRYLQDGVIRDFMVFDYGKDRISKKSLLAADPLGANRENKTIYISYIYSRGQYMCLVLSDGEKMRDLFLIPGKMPLTEITFRWSFDHGCNLTLLPAFTSYHESLFFLTDVSKLQELGSSLTTDSKRLDQMIAEYGQRQGLLLLKTTALL